MGEQATITIVTLIENDPITGVKYGEKEITVDETLDLQRHIARYLSAKARRKQLMHRQRTMQK